MIKRFNFALGIVWIAIGLYLAITGESLNWLTGGIACIFLGIHLMENYSN